MRVCIDARFKSGTVGGVAQFVLGLATGLSQLGDGDEEYLFLANRDESDWLLPHIGSVGRLLFEDADPAPTRTAWSRRSRRLRRVPASSGAIERGDVDVMHFTWQAGFLTAVRSIYHPHDLQHIHLPEHFTQADVEFREANYRVLCARARMVAVASEWVKRDLIRHYHLSEKKVKVIHLAPPVEAYPEPSASDLAEVSAQLDLPESFIFYPAQTWPHKNHLSLLRALGELRERHGLVVPLVCSGHLTPHYQTIEETVKDLDLEDQVRFLGFVSPVELQYLYRRCRAVVVPTLFEAGSFPVMEAFRVGAPAACSTVTSLPELAGTAALLFDPLDLQDMAEAIRRLWTDDDLRQLLVQRGHERIQGETWTRTARVFRAHYRRLSGRRLNEEDIGLTGSG